MEFVPNVGAWLNSLEGVFAASRFYQAGSIAMLRSGLIAAEQGHLPAGLQFRGRPTRSRVLNAVAWQALQRAADMTSTLIAEKPATPCGGRASRSADRRCGPVAGANHRSRGGGEQHPVPANPPAQPRHER